MVKREEMIDMKDGTRIHLTVYSPDCKAFRVRGVVLLAHGFGEHAGCYERFSARFCERDYAVFVPDLRGHGKTPGKRGVVKSGYGSILSDLEEIKKRIIREYPGRPVILYGHNMGGNMLLNYILERDVSSVHCAVSGSPWLGLDVKMEGIMRGSLWLMSSVAPDFTARIKLPLDKLSRDEAAVEAVKNDQLHHFRLSIRLLREISERGSHAIRQAGLITVPTLVLMAGKDNIVSNDAIRSFCGRASDKVSMTEYADAYHELHNEINAAEIFQDIWRFIQKWV